ncbi:MAG: ABC transporter ATP-binding protein [Candidatus Babeliales bacterium]
MNDVLINIKDLSKIYTTKQASVRALDDISLTIKKGEVLSLLGVNGAGKTTLSSILATLHPPTTGNVYYKGLSIYKDLSTYRRAVGFCPQRPNLDTQLTVEQNLVFAGRYFLLPKDQILEKVHDLIDQFSLNKYAHFNVNALSGGYKQRVLIARALMHNPEIIILDEPTVGLDPDIRRQLWNIIKDLKNQGMTVILTTHYLEEAEILSDRVCMLSRGKILLTATVKELKEKHKKATLEEVFLTLVEQQNAE